MEHDAERQVHWIPDGYRIRFILMPLAFLFGILLFGAYFIAEYMENPNDTSASYVGLFLALFLGLCVVWVIWGNWKNFQTYIATTPEAIEFDGVQFHLRSSWKNLKAIETLLRLGEVITFHKNPEILGQAFFAKSVYPYPLIPLVYFPGWREDTLGAEIKKYRPDLWQDLRDKPGWD